MRRIFIVVFIGLVWSLASGQGNQTGAENSSAKPIASKDNKDSGDADSHSNAEKNQAHAPSPIFVYGGTFSQYGDGTVIHRASDKEGQSWGDYALIAQAIFAGVTLVFLWLQYCILKRQTKILVEQANLSEKFERIAQQQLAAFNRQGDALATLTMRANEWDLKLKDRVYPPRKPPA